MQKVDDQVWFDSKTHLNINAMKKKCPQRNVLSQNACRYGALKPAVRSFV